MLTFLNNKKVILKMRHKLKCFLLLRCVFLSSDKNACSILVYAPATGTMYIKTYVAANGAAFFVRGFGCAFFCFKRFSIIDRTPKLHEPVQYSSFCVKAKFKIISKLMNRFCEILSLFMRGFFIRARCALRKGSKMNSGGKKMKRKLKSALSLLLCMIMVFGAVAVGGEGIGELFNGGKAEAAGYSVGDIITFGSYPQSEVTKESDSATYAKLEAATKNWISYGYYSGDGSYGSMQPGDWMKYADITLGGEKYRAVRFTQYRPEWAKDPGSSDNSNQEDNGYTINNIYYFKYEPLKWQVLDPKTGLVLSKSIIDSQAYSNTIYEGTDAYGYFTFWNNALNTNYANDYATSSIRKWLNRDFYSTAFTSTQKQNILPTTLDNSAYSTDYSKYDSISTTDNVFLLSYSEAQNASYGFTNNTSSTETREAVGTDYAKAQGLCVFSNGCSFWRLRSADNYYSNVRGVRDDGDLNLGCGVNGTYFGIRPALRLSNLASDIFESDLKIITYNVYCKNEKVKNAATGKVTDCRYETRARYIVNNIMDNEPDSIGLQEVTPELKLFLENFEDLNGRILGARYAAVDEYRDSGTDKSNEGCFIYYNKDKYQVVKSGTIWLSESAEKYSKHSESNYARIATYALLENKETGEEYVHVNTHLEHDHTSEKKTNSAAVSGAEQIVQLLNSSFPNTPAVITGDFNQLKGSAPYNVFINAGFYDSRDASQTKNTYHNSYGIGSGSTPYAAKTIDHILYNGYFNKKNYTVYDEDYSNEAKYGRLKLGYQYPSDHHPVVAAIGTKAKEAELLPVTMSLGISSSTKTVLNDRWFTQDNKEYNHELARFCANFVLGGYKSDSGKMKSWLSQAGFNTSEMNFETGRDEVNYFIASKDIKVGGTVKKVVFAGFIGSHDDQWFSNFDPLGNERANWKDRNAPYAPTTSDNTVHKGFADAREYVYARLKKYMSRNGINKDNSILLLAGHSRGAATANLLAAYLIDENSLVSPDRLFTYTFATPNVAKIGKVGDKYNSIFNIVNPEDFVTKVLLSSWGFSRYGITYTLPSQRNDKQHKEYLTAMRRYFREYRDSHIEFEPYNMGEVATYNIVDYLGENVSDLDDFYGKRLKAYQVPVDNIMKWACFTPYYFFRDIMCPIVMNEFSSNELERFLISFPQLSFFGKLVRYFAKINADASVKEKRPFTDFEMAHCMETYCAYTSSLTSSQLTECLKKPEDRRKGYKGTVNCPVDVEVYDKETGELVGRIVNNVIDETVAAKENSIVMDVEGDSKSFWLPSNGDYKVVLIGNDNGTMDYTVAAIDSNTGETERINFYDVIIKDGAKFTGNIDSKDFVLSEHELETEDGKKLASDEYIPDDQKAQVTVTVNVQGDGSASESAKYTKGDYVSLYAYPGMGYYFAGWYENGGLIRNGDNLTFVAKADRDVTAVFEPIKTKISINTPSTTTVSYGFTLNLHANVTDLPEGARIVWSMDGSGFELIPSADGMTCGVKSVSKGSATITAKVVDKNGNAVKNANGNEITASQQLTSKAGFFQRLVAFFKKLFGSNMIIPYALEWIVK